MDLARYVENLHQQLEITAEAGGEEARALAERLLAALDPAIRLTLLDALTAAAEEITTELAPGSVELRLRVRDPEFVVSRPLADEAEAGAGDGAEAAPAGRQAVVEGDEGTISRINLRLPDHLKARIEAAAEAEGVSVNSWLVRAAAAVVERADTPRRRERRAPYSAQRYTGWAR
jgi:hypothetical protein